MWGYSRLWVDAMVAQSELIDRANCVVALVCTIRYYVALLQKAQLSVRERLQYNIKLLSYVAVLMLVRHLNPDTPCPELPP